MIRRQTKNTFRLYCKFHLEHIFIILTSSMSTPIQWQYCTKLKHRLLVYKQLACDSFYNCWLHQMLEPQWTAKDIEGSSHCIIWFTNPVPQSGRLVFYQTRHLPDTNQLALHINSCSSAPPCSIPRLPRTNTISTRHLLWQNPHWWLLLIFSTYGVNLQKSMFDKTLDIV